MNARQKASNRVRPPRLTFKASCTSERLSSSGGWCGHFIQMTKGPPFFSWTSLKRVSKTRLALEACANRGCVILKCILIATTLPLLLRGYTWSCRVILVTHRASRVMFTQNWECIQRAASGRCYSSNATRISWKVSGFLSITDEFHSSPSEHYYLYPYLPRTLSCCISMGVKMILWVRFTCTGPQTPGEAWRDQWARLTYWITRLDGRAGWRVWENKKGERRRQERIQERGSGNRGVTRNKEERKGRVGKSSAVATRDFNLQSSAPLY